MSETGGPVYEGSSARPEQKPSPVVEKVKMAVNQKMDAVRATAKSTFEGGESVYDAHMEAWQKIVNEIPPEQRNSANVKIQEFWRKAGGRVDDVVTRVVDFGLDHAPMKLAADKILSKKGAEYPKQNYAKERAALIRAHGDYKAAKVRVYEQKRAAIKQLTPLGKVMDIVDKIVGPRLTRI